MLFLESLILRYPLMRMWVEREDFYDEAHFQTAQNEHHPLLGIDRIWFVQVEFMVGILMKSLVLGFIIPLLQLTFEMKCALTHEINRLCLFQQKNEKRIMLVPSRNETSDLGPTNPLKLAHPKVECLRHHAFSLCLEVGLVLTQPWLIRP